MKKYIEAIKEYSKNEYKKITREAVGELKFPFIVPGTAYQNQLWDWDSWLTDVAISQIRNDNGESDEGYIEYEKGCILNFLDWAKEDGRIIPANSSNTHVSKFSPFTSSHISFICISVSELK